MMSAVGVPLKGYAHGLVRLLLVFSLYSPLSLPCCVRYESLFLHAKPQPVALLRRQKLLLSDGMLADGGMGCAD
jgi:hypothetical protein